MNFKYIPLGENIYSRIIEDHYDKDLSKVLFISKDLNTDLYFIRSYPYDFLHDSPTFISFNDLKEKIFTTDKVYIDSLLKRFYLYEIIKNEPSLKERITDYFDSKDIAKEFFAFYHELYLNELNEVPKDIIEDWQRTTIDTFTSIKEKFDDLLAQNNYYNEDWLEKIDNYDDHWINNYDEIVLIDIPYIPKLYKKIFTDKLNNKNIVFYLNMQKEYYDEDSLTVGPIKIPQINNTVFSYVDILQSERSTFQLVDHIYSDDGKINKDINIYSPDPEDDRYSKNFPQIFKKPSTVLFSKTEIYKFFQIINNIIDSLEDDQKYQDQLFQMEDMLEVFHHEIFKRKYKINLFDEQVFNTIISNDYKYLSSSILEESFFKETKFLNEKLSSIMSDVLNIHNANSYKEYIKLIQELLFPLNEESKKPVIGSNEDILAVMKVFEYLKERSLILENYDITKISNIKIGNFYTKLILEAFKSKKLHIPNDENISNTQLIPIENINDLIPFDPLSKDTGIFLDIVNTNIPNLKYSTPILTQAQKEKIGSPTDNILKNIEKYYFLQKIFSFKNTILFTFNDPGNKIEYSPFLEELILRYSLKPLDIAIQNDQYINIIKNKLINKNPIIHPKEDKDPAEEEAPFSLPNTKDQYYLDKDANNYVLNLGAYNYLDLAKCQLKFYLKKIKNLDSFDIYDSVPKISSTYLGNFLHKGLEIIFKDNRDKFIKTSSFLLEPKYIEDVYTQLMKKDLGKKISYYNENYYTNALIPLFTKNVLSFLSNLDEKFKGKKITGIDVEQQKNNVEPIVDKTIIKNDTKDNANIKVYIKGRPDLIIRSDQINSIYDYKAKKPSTNDKNNYDNYKQVNFYAVSYFKEANNVDKNIFYAWNGALKDNIETFFGYEDVKNHIINFIDCETFSLSENIYNCNYCPYMNICGRG